MESASADPEALLAATPDAGFWKGVLYRLGLLREIDLWGRHYLLRNAAIDARMAWFLRHGRYEAPEARLALRHFDAALPLVELGGGIGVLACLLNARLKVPEDHLVVEMHPVAADLIERNKALNGARFRLVRSAIHYGGKGAAMSHHGAARFDAGNRVVAAEADKLADTTTLSKLVAGTGWRRFNLLMDIEGMETLLVAGEGPLLRTRVACAVVEFHPNFTGSREAAQAIQGMVALGFALVDWAGDSMAFVNTAKAATASA